MNSNNNLIGVLYLEGQDIKDDGSLMPHVGKGKPVLLMVQANYCGHCVNAKPEFQKMVSALSNVVIATIQSDGDENDKLASKKLGSKKGQGVPCYMGFDKNGNHVRNHQGGRDVAALSIFANQL